MTKFVKIENGIVVDSISLSEEDALSGVDFIVSCGIDGLWIESEAGIGFSYNHETKIFSAPQRTEEDELTDVGSSSGYPPTANDTFVPPTEPEIAEE